MELKEGIYKLPPHLKAVVRDGDTIIVSTRARLSPYKHCRDCEHCKVGKYKFSPNQWWESTYCEMKPKKMACEGEWWYAAPEGRIACELFKPKRP